MAGTASERAAEQVATYTDWPTLVLVAGFWVALISVALLNEHIPSVVVIVVLAILGGLYMSLQHEVIHGHPTRWHRFNRLLIGAPLGLLQPFSRYRATHLAHHESDLTDPVSDPESFYVLPETWEHANAAQRGLLQANRTLAARLTLGPFLAAWRMINYDIRAASKERGVASAWLVHIVGCGVVIVAVMRVGLPVWTYFLGFVYGGASWTALRSFVEHRAVASGSRSAVVHTGWFLSVLFLNNNLHYTHHQLPGAAWFRLPELTATLDADTVVADGAGSYRSYRDVLGRYLFRQFDQPVAPLSAKMEV